MKKLFILALVCLMSTSMFAQSDSTKLKTTGYLSVGLSLSNGSDFNTGSYSSVEGGFNYGNFGLGLIFGRGNLDGIGKNDNIQNYYYELKTTANYPLGILSGNIIFGYGGYINTPHMFIEYGAGISYSKGIMGYGVTVSNWDGGVYLTPSITVNF
jgi:hypothetical protein